MRTKYNEPTIYEKISYIVNYARQKWRGEYWYEEIGSVSGISYRTWYHWLQKDSLPVSKLHLLAIDALYERFLQENRQQDSFEWFLQKDIPPDERKPQGLQKVFLEIFPIEDVNNKVVLEFVEYNLGELKYTEEECRYITCRESRTYGVPLRVKLRLICRETGEIRE